MALVVIVWRGAGEITLQQFPHLRAARCAYGAAGYYLEKQTSRGVRRQFVSILAVRSARNFLAAISIFAKCLLVDVDVREAQRRVIAIHEVTLVLPHFHLFRRQLVAARRVRQHIDNILRRFV